MMQYVYMDKEIHKIKNTFIKCLCVALCQAILCIISICQDHSVNWWQASKTTRALSPELIITVKVKGIEGSWDGEWE